MTVVDPQFQDYGGDRSGNETSTAETLLLPIIRHRFLVAAFTFFGIAAGLFIGIVSPNEFRSEGKLLFIKGQRELDTPEGITPSTSVSQRREDIENELSVLRSEDVFENASNRLNNMGVLKKYDPAANDDENTPWLARQLHGVQSWWVNTRKQANAAVEDGIPGQPRISKRALEIASQINGGRRSNIITVSHHNFDPQQAQQITQVLLEECVRRHQDFYSPKDNLDSISQEYTKTETRLKQVNSELSDYSTTSGLYDLEQQKSARILERNQLEAQLVADRREVGRLEAELEDLRGKLADEPELLERPAPDAVQINPLWTQKNRQVEEKKTELNNVGFSEKTRERQKLEDQLERLQGELAETPREIVITGRIQKVANARWDILVGEKHTREIAIKGLQSAIAASDVRKRELSDDLAKIARLGAGLEALELKARVLKRKKEELARQLEHYQYLSSLSDSNLRIVENATLELTKFGPNRFKYLLFGLFCGVGLGGCLAFLRNSLNRILRRPEEIETKLGVRVLSVIPRSAKWEKELKALPR